jgi:hypothetical protein
MTALFVIIAFTAFYLIFSAWNLHRLEMFYLYVMQISNDRARQRHLRTMNNQNSEDIPYIDVVHTYRQFDKLKFWQTDFSDCIVFEDVIK